MAVYRQKPDRPPPGYKHLPTRLVVFGDGSPMSNALFDKTQTHRDLALNTARWLLGNEREIGSGNKFVVRRIKWSPGIASFLFWVPIFLFPGIVLCLGVSVYFLRRN